MSGSYETLEGASGRERFFRPQRHDAAELFSGAPPCLWFDDEEFDLENISARGAGCVGHASGQVESYSAPGVTGLLRLTQSGRDIFRATARKARSSTRFTSINAGFELESEAFDLHALVRENAAVLAANAVQSVNNAEPSQEYKTFCAETAAFIGGYLRRIDKHIAPIESNLSEAERNNLARELADGAEIQWQSILQTGNTLVAKTHSDKVLRIGIKSFTENLITQLLLEGPGWARCYNKPAGYPGDYQMMNYGYEQKPEGVTVRQKFLHLLGMIASSAILSRRKTLASLIVEYASDHHNPEGNRFAITSVGCGPARELESILKRTPSNIGWDVTLIDQEPEALEYVFKNAIEPDPQDRLTLKGLNISFREMLKPSPDASFANSDIIYSSGFVDYLNPLLAQRFVKRLYDYVKPGGRVIIGNVNNLQTGMIWPLEYITDWSLYFRGEDDMRAMAREIPEANVSIRPDESNAIYFLVAQKPARD